MKTLKPYFISILSLGMALTSPLGVFGQSDAAPNDRPGIETTQDSLQKDQGMEENLSKDGEGTSPSGTQRPVKKAEEVRFTFIWDTEIYYTDNFFLSGDGAGKTDIDIYQNTFIANASFGPYRLDSTVFAPKVGIIHQRFYHGITQTGGEASSYLDGFDFDNIVLYISNVFKTASAWEFDFGLEYSNLFELEDYDRTYRGLTPYFQAKKTIAFNRKQFLVLSGDIRRHFTDVETYGFRSADLNDRSDISFVARFYQLAGPFTISPYYRFSYSSYSNGYNSDREDIFQVVGINLMYRFNKYVSAKAFGSYEKKDIKNSFYPDYDKTTFGLGATLRF